MKSFEIIEEGRLSKSEMSTLVGGSLSCSPSYVVLDPKDCNNKPTGLAICSGGGTGIYASCASNGTNNHSCSILYSGSPYGGGDVTTDPAENTTGIAPVPVTIGTIGAISTIKLVP